MELSKYTPVSHTVSTLQCKITVIKILRFLITVFRSNLSCQDISDKFYFKICPFKIFILEIKVNFMKNKKSISINLFQFRNIYSIFC